MPRVLGSERSHLFSQDPAYVMKKAQSGETSVAEVTEVLPRIKEGGAFVKFTYAAGSTPLDIHKIVAKHLREKNFKPWWAPLQGIRAGLVMGKPWVEDLYRIPSARLRVEFLPSAPGAEVADLSQEQLYAFFRPYGKLADIVIQPSDSKVLPKFAYLDFNKVKKAVMAKVGHRRSA